VSGRNRCVSFAAAWLLGLLLVLGVQPAWGQATTSLRGVVTDPSGAAVPNAQVTLTNTATNTVRTAVTGSDGAYAFTEVQPGTYTLTVEAQGFRKYERRNLVLQVSLPATVNVRLEIGAVSQVVSVTAEAPLLNRTDASLGQTMGSLEIQELPLEARNVPQLLSLQPGVVYTSDRADIDVNTDTRSGAVNGERSDQSNITLDGVSVNDEFNRYAFTSVLPITVDSVQEFRVTTSNYDASQGRSAGGQIALVTKGGTNQFHGSLYEVNRNTATVANDFFIKTAEALSGQPNRPPKLIRNTFGGSIGGPFVKDRFFFFFNYEGRRDAQEESVVRSIPSQTLRDGIIEYPCADPAQCPGGTVTGVSGHTYAVPAGVFAIGPAQLKNMDPLHIGPSPVALAYFNTYPLPNDTTVGDGLNYTGFRFPGPVHRSFNWYIGRLDYKLTRSGSQSIFWRGSGRDDRVSDVPFLPGRPPTQTTTDLSKGFVVGYTGSYGPHWVNNFRYGLTRQSLGIAGNSNQPWIFMRNLSQGIFRSHSFTLPVHNIVDDVSWIKGAHTFQFGVSTVYISRASLSQENSFSDAVTNASWLDTAGIANTGNPLDPAVNGFPQVDPGFNNSYDFPLIAMMGIATEVDATYNFHLNPNGTGTALPQGAPVPRHFKMYEYGLYWQDTWQARPNLTINYGVRWELMSPIWESEGQEVTTSFSLGRWFNDRSLRMRMGQPSNLDPLVQFIPGGNFYDKPNWYHYQKKNVAPRLSIAWSPRPHQGWLERLLGNDRTVFRAGFGMYYDHFGPGLAVTFDRVGSFGLSTTLTNPAGVQTVSSAPRITSMNVIPTTDNNGNPIFIPAPPASFPQTFPNTLDTGGFAITWGLDDTLKTPYSYAVDFSIERALPGQMTLDLAYVGHFAHRLLVQEDLAMPYNLVDPKTGVDYFSAVRRLAELYRQGIPTANVTPQMVGPTAQYWTDMMTPQGSYGLFCSGGSTPSPLQAAYDLFSCFSQNETTALFVWDLFGLPANPTTGLNSFFNPQFSSLYAWRSVGFSNYNALQVSLQKRMSHGVLFGFNYTFSKSLDVGSDAERIGAWGGLGGQIINSWDPYQLYGPSDFDLRHQINANWVVDLPFGRGRLVGSHVSGWADAFIGGWQVSGLARWSSGFPVSVAHGFEWPTNWQLSGWAILTGKPVNTGRTVVAGNWNLFPDPQAAIQGFAAPFPGQSGVRNAIRGDGYLGWDMSLGKQWQMPYRDTHRLRFRWSVFNVPNIKRFDVQSASLELDQASTFGRYTRLLTNPRVMQFELRYEF
jgi:protocatechuate 3,4-dioxygenase beta subunit